MPALIPGMPMFAPVAARLLDLLAMEDAVVEQVAALLQLEPQFVEEVLRLAGTPVFGFQRQVRSLAHVVAALGTERLRALIATVALRQAGGERGVLYGYWRHSVAAGFLAAEWAPGWDVDPDRAYTAALMHDHSGQARGAGLPAPSWSGNGASEGRALAEMVELACGISEVLGFPTSLHPGRGACLDELLEGIPQAARRSFPSDFTRLARTLHDKIAWINN